MNGFIVAIVWLVFGFIFAVIAGKFLSACEAQLERELMEELERDECNKAVLAETPYGDQIPRMPQAFSERTGTA